MSTNEDSISNNYKTKSSSTISRLFSTAPSSRASTASSFTSKYTSGMRSMSTSSSMDDMHSFTSNSSAIDFLNDSMDSEFNIIDTLEFEDIDEGVMNTEFVFRNRESIIDNLIHSEEAYLESLELLLNQFYLPLKKDSSSSSFSFLGMKKVVCTERELKWLFVNLEEIVNVHRLTLKSLQERLRIWGPTQILSDVFQAWFPNLECYKVYLSHYDVVLTTYERLTRYPPFKKFLDNAQKDKALKGLTLLNLLQLPVGCIDRYLDTITKLVDITPPMHPDYTGLNKSKSWLQNFYKSIHEKLIDAKNVAQVLHIHQNLVGAPFTVRAERRLVIQGNLERINVNTKSTEDRIYILFTDLLFFGKIKNEGNAQKIQYKGHLVLERARIRTLKPEEAGGFEYCIEIVSSFSGVDNLNTTYIGAPTTHVFRLKSKDERKEWLHKLDYVIKRLDKIASAKHAQATRRMMQNRTARGSFNSHSTQSSNDESSSKNSTHYTN